MKIEKNILISIPNARMVRAFLDTDIFAQIVKNNEYYFYVIHNMTSISKYIDQYDNVEEVLFPKIERVSVFVRLFQNAYGIPIFKRALKKQYAWKRFLMMKNPSIKQYLKRLLIIFGMIFFYIISIGQFYKLIKLFLMIKMLKIV